MKNSLFFYPLFALLFAPVFAFAQWSPNTTSTLSSIHREGSVGIGLEESPYARLHVRQEIRPTLPGQEVGFIPTQLQPLTGHINPSGSDKHGQGRCGAVPSIDAQCLIG
ncbi:MAG: hypothetical protein AAFZ63_23950, partial [Bacteroidota bacterium]